MTTAQKLISSDFISFIDSSPYIGNSVLNGKIILEEI
jgi:hypothetical protein